MRASRGIDRDGAAPGIGAERLAVRGIVAESAADLACALLQATDYGILMTDPQGRDLVGNRRFGELFGVDVGGVVEMSRSEVRALFGHHCAAVLLWDERAREFRGAFAPPAEAGPTEELCVPSGREPDLERAIGESASRPPIRLRDFQAADGGPLLERGCGAG